MLKRRVTESHRFGVPISVLYLKIEEYDIVNRKYGSPIARQMVDAAAPAFQKVLREMDVMTKLDNGEFVVMLPGSTQAGGFARGKAHALGDCQLRVAARRSRTADPFSTWHRRTQSRTKPPKNCWPAHGQI